ncbi:hypothetical protein M427DRAFT_70300 [Gonapodya prolifera JEL478]|uniref:Uncharacterized protein n=1 Tax=Gonapodya prolifera (strain JEL478) TaxID=1344416 RepID=A0A139ADZ3_GONPJ|nr:hypothetical protein M427DRAFT_70300 [Gonapodya prolifera JEL478]|eukprot:KXS14980.1 hypothetical protein M427DRAFT_70300 [Gonapodya prolifera JEL478]
MNVCKSRFTSTSDVATTPLIVSVDCDDTLAEVKEDTSGLAQGTQGSYRDEKAGDLLTLFCSKKVDCANRVWNNSSLELWVATGSLPAGLGPAAPTREAVSDPKSESTAPTRAPNSRETGFERPTRDAKRKMNYNEDVDQEDSSESSATRPKQKPKISTKLTSKNGMNITSKPTRVQAVKEATSVLSRMFSSSAQTTSIPSLIGSTTSPSSSTTAFVGPSNSFQNEPGSGCTTIGPPVTLETILSVLFARGILQYTRDITDKQVASPNRDSEPSSSDIAGSDGEYTPNAARVKNLVDRIGVLELALETFQENMGDVHGNAAAAAI